MKFTTNDIRLAAAILITTPAQLVGFDRTDPKCIYFHFYKDDVSEEFVESFYNREIRVDPLRYGMAKAYLSRLVYEGFIL